MRVALDATYSIDSHPSGIAVYSRSLIYHLARIHPGDRFAACYRLKQFKRSHQPELPNLLRRLLLPPFLNGGGEVFHALNQRVDGRPAKKIVSTFHDLFVMTSDYSSPDFRKRFTDQARRAAQKSDLIIAVSEFTANQVVDLLGVERDRIRVIPHGVYVPEGGSARKREKLILFVGALQKRKNIAGLVKAFEQMKAADWQLVLAGNPVGYGVAEILEQLEKSPVRDRINLAGYVSSSELEGLYARASIFAFPSLDEGFGIPVLEAMAHGVPVLTSESSALGEIGKEAALLVDPTDIPAIAEALNNLANSPDLRNRLTAQGLSRAKLYSWHRTAESTYSAYAELLS